MKTTASWFFVANYLALVALVYRFVTVEYTSDSLITGTVVLLVVAVIATYLVLLPTSVYGISTLIVLRRDRMISKRFLVTHVVLHLLFVLDILSSIVVVEVARQLIGRPCPLRPAARHLLAVVVCLCSGLSLVWIVGGTVALLGGPGWLAGIVAVLSPTPVLGLFALVLIPIVPLITIRSAVRHYLHRDLGALTRSVRFIKLAAIPLFVQNFLLCAALVLIAALLPIAVSRGTIILFFPIGIPIVGAASSAVFVPAVIGTYLMTLSTSCYSLAAIVLMLRTRATDRTFMIINLIMQLIFVLDVISTLMLADRARHVLREPPSGLRSGAQPLVR